MHNEHHHDHEHEHEHAHIYLTLEDDTELECHVIGTFEVDDVEYIALTPVDGEKGEIYLYRKLRKKFEMLSLSMAELQQNQK